MGPLVWTVAGPDRWLDVMPGGSVFEILGKAAPESANPVKWVAFPSVLGIPRCTEVRVEQKDGRRRTCYLCLTV